MVHTCLHSFRAGGGAGGSSHGAGGGNAAGGSGGIGMSAGNSGGGSSGRGDGRSDNEAGAASSDGPPMVVLGAEPDHTVRRSDDPLDDLDTAACDSPDEPKRVATPTHVDMQPRACAPWCVARLELANILAITALYLHHRVYPAAHFFLRSVLTHM